MKPLSMYGTVKGDMNKSALCMGQSRKISMQLLSMHGTVKGDINTASFYARDN